MTSLLLLTPPHSSSLLLTPPHSSSLLLTPPHSSSLLLTPPHFSSLLLTPPHSSSLLLTPPPHSSSLLLHTPPPHFSSLLLHTPPPQKSGSIGLYINYYRYTRNSCMQQTLAYVLQTFFQHEVFVITPTLNAGSRCSRHVCHGNTIILFIFNFLYNPAKNR